jgi:hypothetical protein
MLPLLALAAPFVVSLVVVLALAVLGWRRRRVWSMEFYRREAAHRARVAAAERARAEAAERRVAEIDALQDCAT